MREKRPAAVFTIMQNEPRFLPIWLRYYGQHFDETDIYILDHDSTDVTHLAVLDHERRNRRINVVPVHRYHSFAHDWLRATVQAFQQFLLRSYDMVLFTEADEIVAPDPDVFPGGLKEYLTYADSESWRVIRMVGHEVMHNARAGEPAIRWGDYPLLKQRSTWSDSLLYSKPTLVRVPVSYHVGFHDGHGLPVIRDDMHQLHLLHLHRIDYSYALERHRNNLKRKWSPEDIRNMAGYHNRIVEEAEFERWFYAPDYEPLRMEVMPSRWRGIT